MPTGKVAHFLSLIRFSHTVFALPYALFALVLAVCAPLPGGGRVAFRLQDFVGVLLCMVFARSAAMAFNRLVDRDIDAENPRTENRHLPSGLLGVGEVTWFTVFCAAGFVGSCLLFWPNWIPLALSLPVLLFLLGYSLAKRFTMGAHLWLGIALSLSPICVWLALRGTAVLAAPIDLLAPMVLAVAIATWVAGFDIIYACQDFEFDRQQQLYSVPARFGIAGALRIAAGLHVITMIALFALPFADAALGLGMIYWLACLVIAVLLAYEHALVRPDDLQRIGVAFFNVNAAISVLILAAGGIDAWLG